jgi:predicted RNase H-like HicB family nuclease
MAYRVAVEDMEQNHWVAWVLDLPGCFSSARSQEEAVMMAPTAISRYFTWLKNNGYRDLPRGGRSEVEIVEVFRSYVSEGMYVVNAFFDDDRHPLSEQETAFGVWMLEHIREDLLDLLDRVPEAKIDQPVPGEVHSSILGIVEHIAWMEWWCLDRLGLAFERERMPADPFKMLKTSRVHTQDVLPDLAGVDRIETVKGERWSPRKLLRRILWHEQDHIAHITKLLSYI